MPSDTTGINPEDQGVSVMSTHVYADPARRVPQDPWERNDRGNHRVVIHVPEAADCVRFGVLWRRRDTNPSAVRCRLFGPDDTEIMDVIPVSVNNEYGEFVFRAPTAGTYHLYYMPFELDDDPWYNPQVNPVCDEYRPAADWCSAHGLEPLKRPAVWDDVQPADVMAIESRTKFDMFGPMERPATSEELIRMLEARGRAPALLFPEDRQRPIAMRESIPAEWTQAEQKNSFTGEARPNEYYPFQIGVYALTDIKTLSVSVSNLVSRDGSVIPKSALTCFNLSGRDWLGQQFTKDVDVSSGMVQPLWIGVDIPPDARGTYRGNVTVTSTGGELGVVGVELIVSGEYLPDKGDSELWRLSRLRWLDSPVGISDRPTKGFPAARVYDSTIDILGRTLRLSDNGLPERIASTFSQSVTRVQYEQKEILAAPVRFVVRQDDKAVPFSSTGISILKTADAGACWLSSSQAGGMQISTYTRAEFDGYVMFDIKLAAEEACDLSDVRLEIPLQKETARYMMGMGFRGGNRPETWDWEWNIDHANHFVWLGDVNAGLQLRLRLDGDPWNIYNLKDSGLPESWANDGRGGVSVRENGDTVLLTAFSGARKMEAGESVTFRFALLITPFRTIRPAEHWHQRYYHTTWKETDLEEPREQGATIVNLHQGNNLLPNINYPFHGMDALKEFVAKADDYDLKVKFYYTIRELSNYAAELWMLRSLGDEVLSDGEGFVTADQFSEEGGKRKFSGGPWLCEHLIDGYSPAWHQPLDGGQMDEAIATTGLSRWHNYYLEGLGWLIREIGISGLYLDGIGYDRQVMKRVRRVMDDAKEGCLIDFHSGDNYAPQWGRNNPVNQYMEHLPYIDSLWMGEGYDYDLGPDFWLVEVSGIPFGLMGEMLQGGGNPWRGMLYGMTNRLHWHGDPRGIWQLWDDFSMDDAEMLGYWCPDCPVQTDVEDILATVYRKDETALISLASWHDGNTDCALAIDWKSLGINPETASLYAPEIPEFQNERTFAPGERIPVEAGKGWLLIVK